MKRFSLYAIDKNIELITEMATNGTLINQKVIDELFIPYDIGIQFTIDGPREIHDRRRVTIDGKGTYDKILDGMRLIKDNGLLNKLTIRMNVDKENADLVESEINYLMREFPGIYIYPGVVESSSPGCSLYHDTCLQSNKIVDLDKIYHIMKILEERGCIVFKRGFGRRVACPFYATDSYCIDPKLNIYKCDKTAVYPELRIGYLTERGDMQILPEFYKQMDRDPLSFEQCRNCKLLPLCAGGCPADAYFENGTYYSGLCSWTEEMLKRSVLDFIRREYKNMGNDG
jgi:uncharacterized protein